MGLYEKIAGLQISAVADGLKNQPADAGDGEHAFDDDGTGQQIGELQAHDGDHRNQRVAHDMAPKGGASAQALSAGGAHEILTHDLEHR